MSKGIVVSLNCEKYVQLTQSYFRNYNIILNPADVSRKIEIGRKGPIISICETKKKKKKKKKTCASNHP